MNAESAELPTGAGQTPRRGWSLPRWIFFLSWALAIHFALVFVFGAKQTASPREVKNAPQFHLTEGGSPFSALTDPTLFARPHETLDFVPAAWSRPPAVAQPTIRWTEPPQFLPPAEEQFGAAFNSYMQTNRLTMQALNFKPQPESTPVNTAIESTLPQASSFKILGKLAKRPLLNQINVPSIPCNDVLPPARVQVLVDASGTVVSSVALESSDWTAADQIALELARALRFSPAPQTTLGEIIFTWHTVPTNAP